MHLFDYSIYYPSSQAVKQSDLCLCGSVRSSSVPLSQVTVISECSLPAAWEVNASTRSSGCTYAKQSAAEEGSKSAGPTTWDVSEEIMHTWPEATTKAIHSSCFPYAQKKQNKNKESLSWSAWLSWVVGGNEIGGKVMTHRFLSDTANLPQWAARWGFSTGLEVGHKVFVPFFCFYIYLQLRWQNVYSSLLTADLRMLLHDWETGRLVLVSMTSGARGAGGT